MQENNINYEECMQQNWVSIQSNKTIYLDHPSYTYIVNGQSTLLTSVTTLIDLYLRPIQAEGIIDKHYANSQSNPRYVREQIYMAVHELNLQ